MCRSNIPATEVYIPCFQTRVKQLSLVVVVGFFNELYQLMNGMPLREMDSASTRYERSVRTMNELFFLEGVKKIKSDW